MYFTVDLSKASKTEIYLDLLNTTKKMIEEKPVISGNKKLYYISSEFLIGKLLSNNLINLGIYEDVKKELLQHNINISDIEELENEPSLGNGGLGRLAACFIDSISSLNLNGDGVGLLYHFGLFKQQLVDNKQTTVPNEWLKDYGFLNKTEKSYEVKFNDFTVKSRMYELDVLGYNTNKNKLKLFDIETVNENIVEQGIDFDKTNIKENLTLFLYPDDSDENGELLRIYQQYFMVSNAVSIIFDELKEQNFDLSKINEHAVIQINDTHPTLVIVELIRRLMEAGISFEEAAKLTTNTCAYTNHTILAEALEKWPARFIKQVNNEIYEIIVKLDELIKNTVDDQSTYIIDQDNRIHMAHICIHFGFSTNGVAKLHTDILKANELNNFYKLYPERFNNKTNGITFRRWMFYINNDLTNYVESLIGSDFKKDATQLEKLIQYKDDEEVLAKLEQIKLSNKIELKRYIKLHENIEIDENSIYDIQIKRMHEYKRQQMNALYIINKYLEIKAGKLPTTPITFIFGAKAAPAYIIAQDIIHLLLTLSQLINNDSEVNKYIKLVFVENYNVSYAEKLIPACDVSEQISLASKEASGTGNMKFMLNGALTLGTMDGANVEISELVGQDNIYTFGVSSDEVIKLYETASYNSKVIYDNSEVIKRAVDFIISDELVNLGDKVYLERLHNELISKDWFMTLIDLEAYIDVKDKCFADYENRKLWNQKVITNISKAGFFSSDRTIQQYEDEIWRLNEK